MDEQQEDGRRPRRSYDEAFKRDAVRLVAEEGYTFNAAASSLGMSEQSLRAWHAKLVPADAPCGESASLHELKAENALLRKQLKRVEMEREILPLDRSTPRHGVVTVGIAIRTGRLDDGVKLNAAAQNRRSG